MVPDKCASCSGEVPLRTTERCWTDVYTPDHVGLCCDCFDLKMGMPIEILNRERATRGLPPLDDGKS